MMARNHQGHETVEKAKDMPVPQMRGISCAAVPLSDSQETLYSMQQVATDYAVNWILVQMNEISVYDAKCCLSPEGKSKDGKHLRAKYWGECP